MADEVWVKIDLAKGSCRRKGVWQSRALDSLLRLVRKVFFIVHAPTWERQVINLPILVFPVVMAGGKECVRFTRGRNLENLMSRRAFSL